MRRITTQNIALRVRTPPFVVDLITIAILAYSQNLITSVWVYLNICVSKEKREELAHLLQKML